MQPQMSPIDSSDNLFHDGNPLTGIKGTIVTAEWLNAVQASTRDIQAELIAILTASALAPDDTAGQLLAAIRKLTMSRTNPGADLVTDGSVSTFLQNLGLRDIALAGVSSGQLSSNGYIQIPAIIGGVKRTLLIQWGKIGVDYTASHSSYQTVGGAVSKYAGTLTFPVAFPAACFNVVGVSNDSNNLFTAGMYATSLSSAAWSLVSGQGYSSTGSGSNSISWLSIGY